MAGARQEAEDARYIFVSSNKAELSVKNVLRNMLLNTPSPLLELTHCIRRGAQCQHIYHNDALGYDVLDVSAAQIKPI